MAIVYFWGAAQEVTGSCHLVESAEFGKVLLDCGMHQGGNSMDRIGDADFEFSPTSLDAVILSHAHLDHSGMLPRLVHDGYSGPIYCSLETADLLEVMLKDSVGIYMSDLERENRRRARKDKPPLEPEYTEQDVLQTLQQCVAYPYKKPFNLTDKSSVCFHDAGHILGSAIVELTFEERGENKKLVFSGDLGNKSAVLMKEPSILTKADVVLMEGTYGDRNHKSLDDTVSQLKTILQETEARGGNIMIPAFAVGRTQEILFYLGCLHQEGLLKNWQIILDSPMAIEVTRVYDKWFSALDKNEIAQASPNAHSILKDFIPRLFLSVTPQDSMSVNKISKGALIIAGSGMCTGGRIRHHFKQRIWDARNAIIFCGFQAKGTLGRLLVDGLHHLKLFGEDYVVKAQIETLGGFSAHAGQAELIEWISNFENSPKVVLVHGEAKALETLAQKLWEDKQIRATIPAKGESLVF
ncbi:MBL fold metallo-hydrolase [Aliiglaciecola sp. LCG003]|uniref:MBL fold metallo-hydrolase RNA specificity domain-containing protein n=1 Tax=Aliiglaciecola sp. LCG003 TaxID=3053655 RepID=UPI0025746F1A|nr:MBL fold metallo-hydrolase [Aliiglaciecola sp. LCG003]WJG10703.1 MBL fold metallo-hydrolase [Aliiglaciecola sp. LCG003]